MASSAVSVSHAPQSVAKPVNKWAVAVAVATGALLEVIDTSIVNVALPQIQASLGATLTEVSWVVSSYAVANVITLPLSAWLGQRFGKKAYFVFSLVSFTVASMMCGMATSFTMLVVARVLQGLAGGGLLAKAQAILFETFPREEQAMAQAFFGIIVIAGPAIGPTLGGYLVTNVDWRWIFFINLPVGIAAVLLTLAALPADPPRVKGKGVDWFAIALLAAGLGSLQTILEEGNTEDWFDSRFIVTLTITMVVALGTLVWRLLTVEDPVVDLRVLRYRSLSAGSVLSVVVGIALYGTVFAIPLFAQTMLGFTSEQTGMLLLPSALASAVAMPLAGRVLKVVEARIALLGGATFLVLALFWLSDLSPQTGEGDLYWPLIIRSFGTVMMFLPLTLAALGPIPKEDISKATGFFSLTRQLGGSIGVALLTTLLARRETFHRSVLIEKVSANSALALERLASFRAMFMSKGSTFDDAQAKAMALLDRSVEAQALVMSFTDTFVATGILIIVCLPLVALLGKGKGAAPVSDH
ncbi:MAG TPA: DHA2 family efflux MFS transporter permease subunit [Polyangiaceae bacterium]|nr:DHA2 family efflux MFS transporter permease subunit [Polyangiaceae bacterium]